MLCPDCGYMMSEFDKSCSRCEAINKKYVSRTRTSTPPPSSEAAQTHIAPSRPSSAALDSSYANASYTSGSGSQGSPRNLWAITISALVILGVIGSAIFVEISRHSTALDNQTAHVNNVALLPPPADENAVYNACIATNVEECMPGIASLTDAQHKDLANRLLVATSPAPDDVSYNNLIWKPFMQGFIGIAQSVRPLSQSDISPLLATYANALRDRKAAYQDIANNESESQLVDAQIETDKANLENARVSGASAQQMEHVAQPFYHDNQQAIDLDEKRISLLKDEDSRFSQSLPIQ